MNNDIKNINDRCELIYIYNLKQARVMANNGARIFRFGLGNQGDICVTFEKTVHNLQVFRDWQDGKLTD